MEKPTESQKALLRLALGFNDEGVLLYVRETLKKETGQVKRREDLTAHDFGRAIGRVKRRRMKRKKNRP